MNSPSQNCGLATEKVRMESNMEIPNILLTSLIQLLTTLPTLFISMIFVSRHPRHPFFYPLCQVYFWICAHRTVFLQAIQRRVPAK